MKILGPSARCVGVGRDRTTRDSPHTDGTLKQVSVRNESERGPSNTYEPSSIDW